MRSDPSPRLSAQQIASIEEAFYNFDLNHDGEITSTEFLMIIGKFGIPKDVKLTTTDALNIFNVWDKDGNGKVDFKEFLSAVIHMLTSTDNEEVIRQAFKMFDKVIDKGFHSPKSRLLKKRHLNYFRMMTVTYP